MIDHILAHVNGLVVDTIFAAIVAIIYLIKCDRALLVALGFYLLVLFVAHFGLAFFEYSHQLNVAYHALMIALILIVSAYFIKVKSGYGLFLCALGLNFLLHAAMVLKEPAQQMYLISPSTYTVIYNSYENARIIVVSLQLMGLILGGKYGRDNDINNRLRSRIRRAINDFRVHSLRLLRVKRP